MIDNHILLEQLINKKDLNKEDMQELISRMLNKTINTAQTSAALALLRSKGESSREIKASAQAVLSMSQHIDRPNYLCTDIVGTGGDGHNTINISTIASLVVATLGVPVAKHGNVSVSSKCGSADVLRELGLPTDLNSEQARLCLDKYKWCFLFAPIFHPAFGAVREIRKDLKIKTIFNILGPIVNPIDPKVMLVGVYHESLVLPVAHALRELGKKKVLVVHGSGLDEIALHGPTYCTMLSNDEIDTFEISPTDLGLKEFPIDLIIGDDPAHNARDLIEILAGRGSPAKTSMVAASAGALLYLADSAPSLILGVEQAHQCLRTGQALGLLESLREFKHGS